MIICYSFPPYPGIGGRRWAKFSKYLKRKSVDVSVISSVNPFENKVSEWTSDIEGINVHRLPLKYPVSLITFPKTFIGKLNYRISLLQVKLFGKGNYYDRTLFWNDQLNLKIKELIRVKSIRNIIVSGAPFHMTYQVAKIKAEDQSINLVVDFRDHWTKDTSLSSFSSLSEERINVERKMEKFVCENADKIITVSNEMTDYFNSHTNSSKSVTILNGYDTDDFLKLKRNKYADSKKINIVFTGNLYNNIENVFFPFCEALLKIKHTDTVLYEKLNFEFYGTSSSKISDYVKEQRIDIINFYGQVSLNESLERVSSADLCMLFLNDVYSFSLSTKFCEYIGLRKEILLFSKKGDASQFIENNKLGFWINPDKVYEDLLNVLTSIEKKDKVKKEFDYDQFSVENISDQLIDLLV